MTNTTFRLGALTLDDIYVYSAEYKGMIEGNVRLKTYNDTHMIGIGMFDSVKMSGDLSVQLGLYNSIFLVTFATHEEALAFKELVGPSKLSLAPISLSA